MSRGSAAQFIRNMVASTDTLSTELLTIGPNLLPHALGKHGQAIWSRIQDEACALASMSAAAAGVPLAEWIKAFTVSVCIPMQTYPIPSEDTSPAQRSIMNPGLTYALHVVPRSAPLSESEVHVAEIHDSGE